MTKATSTYTPMMADADLPVTRDLLVERARAMFPTLRNRAVETEKRRSITPAAMQEFADAGFFKIMQPKAFGGYEMGVDVLVDVVIEIAKGCGSSAWIVDLMTLHNWLMGLYGPELQEEIFVNSGYGVMPSAMSPGTAVPTDGGYFVSGNWPYVSGIDHGKWAALNARVENGADGPPDMRFFVLAAEDYGIEDNWHVLGLRGTGSKIVVADRAFVPNHRVMSLTDAEKHGAPGAAVSDSPMFSGKITRVPVFCLGVVAIGVGLAEGVISDFLDRVKSRVNFVRGGPQQTQWAATQIKLATAKARLEAAKQLLVTSARDLMQKIESGETLSIEYRASCRMHAVEVLKICTELTDSLMYDAGTGAIFDGEPLQRAFRDMHALHSHYFLHYDQAAELYGRVLFGLEPNSPLV
ncbi:acyl-CoA dehydrogenase family protein [Govanella unica]|uniref:Acyl-CoA dehydrogenase family protein n=1 Tax=Govanella unica TaxID=2975056 RepID=A0A9X3U0B5_9PROT|nr:acyl-CoA dehydrogenase family protein [Govania unica]MDA5195026.1 acyl-CoA dehydrogenase family protein [Govania unica]